MSSNELGMNPDEIRRADNSGLERRKEWARGRMLGAGAHFVIDSLSEVNEVLDEIGDRLKRGERP